MKKTEDKGVTPQQIKAIHATLRKVGMDDEARHDKIMSFTSGRTAHTNELTFDEARNLLMQVNQERNKVLLQEARVLCRCIYRLSFDIPFLNQGYDTKTEEDFKMNCAKIDAFCRNRTRARKNISQMNNDELRETKRQFEKLVRKLN